MDTQQKRILKNKSEAIFMIDGAAGITGCNKVAEDIFGWSLDEIKGKTFADFIVSDETREQFTSSLYHLKNTGKKWSSGKGIEQKVIHRNGNAFPVEFNIYLVDNFSACSFIITVKNIHKNENQLFNRNQRVVNAILRIAIDDFSLDEILLQALEYVLLFNTPRLIDKGAILLVADDSDYLILKAHKGFNKKQIQACNRVPFGTCHCGRAALTGEIQFSGCVDSRHDIRLTDMEPHGHYCVPICSGVEILGVMSLYLREGHVQNKEEKEMLYAISNILAGVIVRKKNEIQRHLLIKKQEAMITRISDEKRLTESIIQSLNSGLMVCDRKGNIVTLNPSGKKILRQFFDPATHDSDSIIKCAKITAVKRMLEAKTTSTEKTHKIRMLNKRNEQRTLQYTVVPWEGSSGLQLGIILQFNDITETLRLQQEMEKMNRLSTVAEIASAVAHEVRNPLAGIKTMSQAIEESCDDQDENKEYITRIIKQVDRLNDLLANFFTYAKPGKTKKQKISMHHIISEVSQLFRVKLDSKQIRLKENYDEGLPDIYVDPDQIQQVLLNLMLNAIDAIKEKGEIQIRARLADRKMLKKYTDLFPELKTHSDYVVLFFRDNGQGMSPETIADAFEPFFTTKHHGTGLGLAIVYRILNENNAFITIDSSQKQGIGFVMLFERVR